ncbi:hypothetical protein RB213_013365, partial [Colletotrichum asianum]
PTRPVLNTTAGTSISPSISKSGASGHCSTTIQSTLPGERRPRDLITRGKVVQGKVCKESTRMERAELKTDSWATPKIEA